MSHGCSPTSASGRGRRARGRLCLARPKREFINPAPEREYLWTAPAAGSDRFTLEGSAYDTLMHIRDGGCEGPELACNDDTETEFGLELWSTIELDLGEGQTVAIFVDGYNGSGEFSLTIDAI